MSSLSGQKVLVVDDEKDIRELLARVLEDEGISVTTASGGIEALARIPQERPDLVILDLLMPEVSGEEVCQAVKTDPALRDIFIMILSCKDDLKTKLRCLNLGAEEYLVKPISMQELAARVNRFLKLIDQWQKPSGTAHSAPQLQRSAPVRKVEDKTRPTVYLSKSAEQPKETPSVARKQQKERYGSYRVESIAGVGGMGLVYKARDEVLDRNVAVKVLAKEWSASPEFLTRFRREAKLIAGINHPRIAPIYTFAEEDGESYFVLQWCSGGSLATLLKRESKLELLRAIDMILQCAKGLEAAWTQGVVHRDIKPSNLMFDENEYIKIVDFGVASRLDLPEHGDADAVLGSPSYMAPEQARAENTDHRTDIYSLGITFYQMLYGRVPFTGTSPFDVLEKQVKAPFPPYDDLEGTVPPKAYQIIEKMTQKNPAARYQNYADLIKDLDGLRNQLYSQRRLKIPSAAEVENRITYESDNFFDLLANMFRNDRAGILKISWGQLEKKFFVQRKEIISFESPQPDENLWRVMQSRGMIKPEKIPTADEPLEESLNRLLFLHAFTLEDFKTVYREIMMQSALEVFHWPVIRGEFRNAKIEHDPFARIPIAGILFEAARVIPYDAVQLAIRKDQSILRTSRFEEIMNILTLPRADTFLLSRLEDENTTVQTLTWLTALPEEHICRTVYALEKLGAVEYRRTAERRPFRNTPLIHPPEPARSAVVSETIVTPTMPISEVKKQPEFIMPEPKKRVTEPARREVLQTSKSEFKAAMEKFSTGKYWEVERLCAQALRENPKDHRYHHLLARALARHPHSLKAAEQSFRQAIVLNPSSIEYRFDLAFFLKEHGNFDAAVMECEQILEMAPRDQNAKMLMAELERR